MTKKDLLNFLAPFHDDIRVVVRGANKKLMAPIAYRLEYLPPTDERDAVISINLESCAVLETNQHA